MLLQTIRKVDHEKRGVTGSPENTGNPAGWKWEANKQSPSYRELSPELAKVVVVYLGHLRAGGRVQHTLQLVDRTLCRLFAHAQVYTPAALRRVRETDLESFLTDRLSLVLKRTVCSEAGCLRAFWRWGTTRGYVAELDFTELNFVNGSKNPPRAVPTDKEVRAMLAALAPDAYRSRAMIEIMYGSGLRRAEVMGLNHSDLDLSGMRIQVRDAKTGRVRVVPLSSASVLALHLYLSHRQEYVESTNGYNQHKKLGEPQAVFVSTGGARISSRIVDAAVTETRINAGLEKPITTHGLRHACATEMLKGGADLRLIQEMLGHQSLDTTMIYTKVGIEDLKALINRYHPLGVAR